MVRNYPKMKKQLIRLNNQKEKLANPVVFNNLAKENIEMVILET
jgi:hypothetical protein